MTKTEYNYNIMAINLEQFKISPEEQQNKLQKVPLDQFKEHPSGELPLAPKKQDDGKFSFGSLMGNIIPSAGRFIGGIAEAVTNPMDTLKGLGQIGAGAFQSIPGIREAYDRNVTEKGKPILEQNRQAFQNIKTFFSDRYGSPEKAIASLEEDPVGVAADLSILLMGGGSLLKSAKLGKLATATEPITAASRTLKTIIKPITKGTTLLGKESLGVTTGVGGETLKTAFDAARMGSTKFKEALRGSISQKDVLTAAKEGLDAIKTQRGNAYKAQLKNIKGMDNVIDMKPTFKKIMDSLDEYNITIGKEGKLNFSKSTIADATEQSRIAKTVNETLKWKDNTPIGLDTLKRRLGDFQSTSNQGNALASSIKSKVVNVLEKNVKGYKEMTKGYGETSTLINEIERTLSLKSTAAVDSTLRKLTSALRADSSFKRELLTKLDDATKADVAGQVAGSILNPIVPSGLIGRSIFAGGPAAIFLGSGTISPLMLQPLLMSSPRVIGEFLHAIGIGAKYADNIMAFLEKMKVAQTGRTASRSLFQAGRLQLNKKE